MIRTDLFGWFDDPTSAVPAHDPGMGATCPVCADTLASPVKTISLMPAGHDRSYFFRSHKACWEGLSGPEMRAIESSLVDSVIREGII